MAPRKTPDLPNNNRLLDDAELFDKVMASVEPLSKQSPEHSAELTNRKTVGQPAETKTAGAGGKGTPNKKQTRRPSGSVTRDSVPTPNSGMDKRQAARFRRGQMTIEATLDLHGDSQVIAHRRLRQFIQRAHDNTLRCVLIVTGKGQFAQAGNSSKKGDNRNFHKPEPGVLRRNLPIWLAGDDLAPMILSHTVAQPKHGGGGAFYILLRRRRDNLVKRGK